MGFSAEKAGPLLPALIFGLLALTLTLGCQWEHAARCHVLALQRNAARLFILAPAYCLLIFLTAVAPRAKPAFDVTMALLDGYALYVFFGLVVLGSGGEDFVIAQISHVMARARRTGKEAVAASDAEVAAAAAAGAGGGGMGQQPEEEEEEEELDSDVDSEYGESGDGGAEAGTEGVGGGGAAAAAGQRHQRRHHRVRRGPVTYSCCLCIPLHFTAARKLYAFLKRSVTQAMVLRPLFLALSALCDFGAGQPAKSGVRLFRVLALAVLVYAVLTIARVYHLVRRQIWEAFNPVTAFMVVKGFILAITVQDFIIAMIFSAKDRHYRQPATHQALKIYALVVSIEALFYLVCVRGLVHPRIFSSYSPRAAIPTHMPLGQFLAEVYALASGVLDGALPPPEKTPSSLRAGSGAGFAGPDPGMVGPEEFDTMPASAAAKRGGGDRGQQQQGVEIRVLSSSSSVSSSGGGGGVGGGGGGGAAPGTPTRRR